MAPFSGSVKLVRLEPAMWRALREIAWREECRIHDLCSLIARRKHPDTSLTAAIRVFLMRYYRAAATEEGHGRAGHGSFSRLMERAGITQNMLVLGRAVGDLRDATPSTARLDESQKSVSDFEAR